MSICKGCPLSKAVSTANVCGHCRFGCSDLWWLTREKSYESPACVFSNHSRYVEICPNVNPVSLVPSGGGSNEPEPRCLCIQKTIQSEYHIFPCHM